MFLYSAFVKYARQLHSYHKTLDFFLNISGIVSNSLFSLCCVFPVCFCVLLFLIAPFMLSFRIFSVADVSALVPFCPAHCYFTHCLHLHCYL